MEVKVAAGGKPNRPKRPKRSELPRPTGIQALAQAYSHPMRVRILTAMNAPRRRASPIRFAEEWGEDVGLVAYHFRELADLGFLEVVEEHQRRGSIEHVYDQKNSALAWQSEWSEMAPVFKQHMAALTLGLAFEAMGAAIDAGTYESRDDTVLGQDTMRLDERGAREAMTLMGKTVELMMKIREQSAARLQEGEEEPVLISWVAAAYEGTLRPA